MYLPLALAALVSVPIIGTYGKITEIPVVDGIIAGVPLMAKVPHRKEPNMSAATTGALRIVENSGICGMIYLNSAGDYYNTLESETTRGVYQASGYGDIAPDKSLFFWFFAARNNNPNAPVALWFNGGPGSSSMIGLFQEHGPCRIRNDSTGVVNNPWSWNNEVNMLYIDQPVGVGFSMGTLDVSTSNQAAADVWTFLQIFFQDSRFSRYQPNKLAIWTESFGGHYGPAFAAYILDRNLDITNGRIPGVILNLGHLGIGNGLTDAALQYWGLIKYADSNPYHPLVSQDVIGEVTRIWRSKPDGCLAKILNCQLAGPNTVCSDAQNFCNRMIYAALIGASDIYYVPAMFPDPYPPSFGTYLSSITTKIGAGKRCEDFNTQVYDHFAATGDWMRSARPDLERVINSNIRTLIYAGDADYSVNFIGVEGLVDGLHTQFTDAYRQLPWTTYTVAGQPAGQYKQVGTLAYIRVFGAGHEVPAYKFGTLDYGQAASQFFNQIMSDQPLIST